MKIRILLIFPNLLLCGQHRAIVVPVVAIGLALVEVEPTPVAEVLLVLLDGIRLLGKREGLFSIFSYKQTLEVVNGVLVLNG
jgi:hypothetical protein